MQTQTNAVRRPSLIERAAEAYQLAEQINARIEGETLQLEESAILPPVSAPVPGRIAHVDRAELAEAGFILPDAAPTALAEEFRIVKRQLLLSAVGGQGVTPVRNGRAILVSSAEPDEGKTFCAVNLALSMAREKDIEVLLVDADFAKPEILSTLGIEGGPGLVDALCDPLVNIEACVIRTDLANLSVLPAGRALNETTELLASERTRILFEQLLSNPARIVIFDSSPALAASTASVLASLAGQAMMIVRADVTGENELREALGLLSGCEHVRLLLNGVQLAPHGRRFGAYYGYGV
jgi:protein-tyrosine kinase